MADNYLEKRYDEVFNSQKVKIKRIGHTVDELLLRNRSYRGYNKSFVVSEDMLQRIVSACSRIPSARNQQALRFRLVTKGDESDFVLKSLKMGAALPQLHLPFPGTEPEAFIVVCSTKEEDRMIDIDLGIALQSMLLKTVEMGLGGLIIGAFNQAAIQERLQLPYKPLMLLAIGKPSEKIELVSIHDGESQKYYRDEHGVHYVPKIKFDELIIKKQ